MMHHAPAQAFAPRIVRWTVPVIALVCAAGSVACSGEQKSATTDSAKGASTTSQAVVSPASDTAGCGFIAKAAHEHPDSLIAEYLARDGNGEFAQTSAWRDQAVSCPDQAPGWDGLTLIAEYKVTPLAATADTARYVIQYTRIGLLEQDSAGYFVKNDSGIEQDTAVLAHTPYGWRLNGWDQEPHLLKAGALKLPSLKKADKQRLQSR